MVDEKQEGSDRTELHNSSHLVLDDGRVITTREFNLARSGWIHGVRRND